MSAFHFESKKGSEVVVTFERDGEKMRFHVEAVAPAAGLRELATKALGVAPLWGAMLVQSCKTDDEKKETQEIVEKVTSLIEEIGRVATPPAGVA